MKLQVRVNRNVLVQRTLLELGQQIPGHGEEKDAVVEGECRGATAGHGYSHAHDVTKVGVLRHVRVV